MDTVDKTDEVKKRGRPAKVQDAPTPQGEQIAREAQEYKKRRETNKVVESWYELWGQKVSLCKKKANGTVYRTLIGSMNDAKNGSQVKDFVLKLQKENRIRTRV